MSYEIRKNSGCHNQLTPSERRTLTYEKEPVEDLQELWEKYPQGGKAGWYCLIKSLHALYGWNEQADDWTELGQRIFSDKHDKKAGMLLRFLIPGKYSEKDSIIPHEVVIVPLDAGEYILFNSHYPRNRQILSVSNDQIGQVVLLASKDNIWEILTLPVYDYIQQQITANTHNRGIVLQNPNQITFVPPAKNNDYVYFKDITDMAPMLWNYLQDKWTKTDIAMPEAEVTPLTEYARHGYQRGYSIKTLAQVEEMVKDVKDDIRGLTDNVDGGNAFSIYGGCRGIDGGSAFTQFD